MPACSLQSLQLCTPILLIKRFVLCWFLVYYRFLFPLISGSFVPLLLSCPSWLFHPVPSRRCIRCTVPCPLQQCAVCSQFLASRSTAICWPANSGDAPFLFLCPSASSTLHSTLLFTLSYSQLSFILYLPSLLPLLLAVFLLLHIHFLLPFLLLVPSSAFLHRFTFIYRFQKRKKKRQSNFLPNINHHQSLIT